MTTDRVLEERGVILPEPPLIERTLGGLGRLPRVRMDAAEREIAQDVPDAIAVFGRQFGIRLADVA
jgi:hypothetical protein